MYRCERQSSLDQEPRRFCSVVTQTTLGGLSSSCNLLWCTCVEKLLKLVGTRQLFQ